MRERPSPNHDDREVDARIDTIVLHYTGMKSAQEAIDLLCSPQARVSSHYVVEEDGSIWQLVDEAKRAWHAGISFWRGRENLNHVSIGIEIVNPGHDWGYRDFPALQMASVCDLCLRIMARHPIAQRNIVAHSDIAPDRKQDPGERFDWHGLAQEGVGLWPDGVPDLGTGDAVRDAASLRDVRRALGEIGYRVEAEGALDPALSAVLRAFQRHWRPEAITGQADSGTLVRLASVRRLFRD